MSIKLYGERNSPDRNEAKSSQISSINRFLSKSDLYQNHEKKLSIIAFIICDRAAEQKRKFYYNKLPTPLFIFHLTRHFPKLNI